MQSMGRVQGGGIGPLPLSLWDWSEQLEHREDHSVGSVQVEQAEVEMGEVDAVAPVTGGSEADAQTAERSTNRAAPAKSENRVRTWGLG
jgi:hypothetical protein